MARTYSQDVQAQQDIRNARVITPVQEQTTTTQSQPQASINGQSIDAFEQDKISQGYTLQGNTLTKSGTYGGRSYLIQTIEIDPSSGNYTVTDYKAIKAGGRNGYFITKPEHVQTFRSDGVLLREVKTYVKNDGTYGGETVNDYTTGVSRYTPMGSTPKPEPPAAPAPQTPFQLTGQGAGVILITKDAQGNETSTIYDVSGQEQGMKARALGTFQGGIAKGTRVTNVAIGGGKVQIFGEKIETVTTQASPAPALASASAPTQASAQAFLPLPTRMLTDETQPRYGTIEVPMQGATFFPKAPAGVISAATGEKPVQPADLLTGTDRLNFQLEQTATKLQGGNQIAQVGAFGLFALQGVANVLEDASPAKNGKLKVPFTGMLQGTFDLVTNPVKTVQSIQENPVQSLGQMAGQALLFEGVAKTAPVVAEAAQAGRVSKADVLAGAYDTAPKMFKTGDQIDLFLKREGIQAGTVGTPEFSPIPQLTVPISQFNQRPRYFSAPAIDVPMDRQFTLAGTEVIPPERAPGVLPLVEKEVPPFESNPLRVKLEGGEPMGANIISASSSAQSRLVDLPVVKGEPSLNSMGFDIGVRDVSVQSTLTPAQAQGSSLPAEVKGSILKDLYGQATKPQPGTAASSRIDNSAKFDFTPAEASAPAASTRELLGSKGGTASLAELQALDQVSNRGGRRTLVIEQGYELNPATGAYEKKVFDTVLGQDVRGKVTPMQFGVQAGALALAPLATAQAQDQSLIQKQKLGQVQVQSLDLTQASSLTKKKKVSTVQTLDLAQVQTQTVMQKQKLGLAQTQVLELVQKQALDQSQKSLFKQEQTQRTRYRLDTLPKRQEPIKPLTPALRTSRQAPSGAGLFNVLVRKQGKFVSVGTGYSDLSTAYNRGVQAIKNTARASFKIVTNFGEVKPNIAGDRALRYSRADQNVVVQKAPFRISSPGEKQEITRKGTLMQKARRSVKKTIFG